MKKTAIVFFVAFLLSLSCASCLGNSKILEEDAKSGEFYSQAKDFNLDDRASLQIKTNKALNNLIRTASGELRKQGHNQLAEIILQDWTQRYDGFVFKFTPGRDVGDHEAIEWLKKIHADIESVIGVTACKALHLHDIWVLAYTIPVVFSCVDHVDVLEYSKHFIPFSGAVSYWVSYGVCVGVSALAGGAVLYCGLIGMGVEEIVIRFVAPPLIPRAYKSACK